MPSKSQPRGWSSEWCKVFRVFSKSDAELNEMKLRLNRSADIFDADCINKGDTIPDIEQRNSMDTQHLHFRYPIRFYWVIKLRDLTFPVQLSECEQVITSLDKDIDGIVENLDSHGLIESVQSRDFDKEFEDFLDICTYFRYRRDLFFKHIDPSLQMETNFLIVVGKRMMIAGKRLCRTCWTCILSDLTNGKEMESRFRHADNKIKNARDLEIRKAWKKVKNVR